ncbi:hypothetical protein [Undibacterium flavidum]|uniref:PspA/IM30 family protein n=1 Tax=Undibacterium flavidum TaxID=2762297 RepID=A0ABR6Y601_9BURK|nr:hypothetical protein [Undibacterium flavidum]MBC3872031.1 hypothetical protein [Undibacterium flavidum]
MSWMDKLSALGGVIAKPFEILADYCKEPIRNWEHERNETAKSNAHQLEKEFELAKISAESDARIRERQADTDLAIKRETEIEKISIELDEWIKDQEVARFERLTESIIKYRQQFVELNINATNAIGLMQLELRSRAHDLIVEKVKKYKALQDDALLEAAHDFTRIEKDFVDNPAAKKILMAAVEKKLSTVIDGATNLMGELQVDLRSLNESISSLANSGEKFINNHLQQFHSRQIGSIEHLTVKPTDLLIE